MLLSKQLIAVLALLFSASTIAAHSHDVHRRHHHRRLQAQHTNYPSRSDDENPTTTDTGNASASTDSGSNDNKSNGNGKEIKAVYAALAPMKALASWSTSPLSPNPLPLSDDTLRPIKAITSLKHPYVPAPDGQLSMEVTYEKGSWTFGSGTDGGVSFYALGPDALDLASAREIIVGYSAYFEDGFDFHKGGKMPGPFVGNSLDEAVSCSGGRHDDACASCRLMWREDGAGEMYTYLPYTYDANKRVCDVPPFSTCNAEYGASVARGSFFWKAGASTAVAIRMRLNDIGEENAELELWADGKSVAKVDGLVIRDSEQGRFWGVQTQSFFGGSSRDWASPQTQRAWFRDFTMTVTERF